MLPLWDIGGTAHKSGAKAPHSKAAVRTPPLQRISMANYSYYCVEHSFMVRYDKDGDTGYQRYLESGEWEDFHESWDVVTNGRWISTESEAVQTARRSSSATANGAPRGKLKGMLKNTRALSFRGATGDEESRTALVFSSRFLAPLGMTMS